MDRDALLAGLIGQPYDKQTRNCWHVVSEVQRDLFGRELPTSPYADRHERARILASHPERARWEQVANPADGDLVLMARAPGQDIHAGVYLADRQAVIHADAPHGVVLDTVLELEQARRWWLSFYRPGETS